MVRCSVLRNVVRPYRAVRSSRSLLGFCFVCHGHYELRREDAALLFCGWHPLNSVNTIFVSELAVCVLAADQSDDFLEWLDGGFGCRGRLHSPALRLGVSGIHTKKFGYEDVFATQSTPRDCENYATHDAPF